MSQAWHELYDLAWLDRVASSSNQTPGLALLPLLEYYAYRDKEPDALPAPDAPKAAKKFWCFERVMLMYQALAAQRLPWSSRDRSTMFRVLIWYLNRITHHCPSFSTQCKCA